MLSLQALDALDPAHKQAEFYHGQEPDWRESRPDGAVFGELQGCEFVCAKTSPPAACEGCLTAPPHHVDVNSCKASTSHHSSISTARPPSPLPTHNMDEMDHDTLTAQFCAVTGLAPHDVCFTSSLPGIHHPLTCYISTGRRLSCIFKLGSLHCRCNLLRSC